MDMGFVGHMFTWHKHFDHYMVWERLDRVVAPNDWFFMFSYMKTYHLDITTLDHKLLWIVPEGMDCKQQKPFRFEQMWKIERGCGETIEAVWMGNCEKPNGMRVWKKIDNCGKELIKWSKNILGL